MSTWIVFKLSTMLVNSNINYGSSFSTLGSFAQLHEKGHLDESFLMLVWVCRCQITSRLPSCFFWESETKSGAPVSFKAAEHDLRYF